MATTSEPCSTALTKESNAEKYYSKENSIKEEVLYTQILEYYQDKAPLIKKIESICAESNIISLRRLDAIVTKNILGNLCYYLPGEGGSLIPFNMIASYLQQLRHYQKRYFDSFRRRKKIMLEFTKQGENNTKQGEEDEMGEFETSYSQLNFFIWVDRFKLLENIPDHAKQSQQQDGQKQKVIKNKNKQACDHLILFHAPQTVPAILQPTTTKPAKLLLTQEKEYALLQEAILYYSTQAMTDLIRKPSWTKLLPKKA